MYLGMLANFGGNIVTGIVGGIIGAGLNEASRYFWGWRQAKNNKGADYHITGTMYARIHPDDPAHKRFLPALEQGKTHVQELIWLGGEVPLDGFLSNRYLYRQVLGAMGRVQDAGLLMGVLPKDVERQLLKKTIGYHNLVPNTVIVNIYRKNVGVAEGQRVKGISPPTYEHYDGSPHRRVLRSMFIADSQLENGLPPKDKVHFPEQTHAHRYETLTTIIEDYRKDPAKYHAAHAFF